ncbi:hypothetical protein GCM10009753_69130 [Streptantibioticus ferralitis]
MQSMEDIAAGHDEVNIDSTHGSLRHQLECWGTKVALPPAATRPAAPLPRCPPTDPCQRRVDREETRHEVHDG